MNVDLFEANWFKSSRSGPSKECVEAAHLTRGRVGIRDSKDPTGPALIFTPAAWDTFLVFVSSAESAA
ncbi:DUF397 domain-containing protein [Nocardia jejuensis]|uniref:DUF397 domain-containing protein n=1 Tax=Nocardia jejuensis TaxID=328049 RepID=UPI00083477C8|nr:DUF397 domain-containing protein [Nocardia jejuensis]